MDQHLNNNFDNEFNTRKKRKTARMNFPSWVFVLGILFILGTAFLIKGMKPAKPQTEPPRENVSLASFPLGDQNSDTQNHPAANKVPTKEPLSSQKLSETSQAEGSDPSSLQTNEGQNISPTETVLDAGKSAEIQPTQPRTDDLPPIEEGIPVLQEQSDSMGSGVRSVVPTNEAEKKTVYNTPGDIPDFTSPQNTLPTNDKTNPQPRPTDISPNQELTAATSVPSENRFNMETPKEGGNTFGTNLIESASPLETVDPTAAAFGSIFSSLVPISGAGTVAGIPEREKTPQGAIQTATAFSQLFENTFDPTDQIPNEAVRPNAPQAAATSTPSAPVAESVSGVSGNVIPTNIPVVSDPRSQEGAKEKGFTPSGPDTGNKVPTQPLNGFAEPSSEGMNSQKIGEPVTGSSQTQSPTPVKDETAESTSPDMFLNPVTSVSPNMENMDDVEETQAENKNEALSATVAVIEAAERQKKQEEAEAAEKQGFFTQIGQGIGGFFNDLFGKEEPTATPIPTATSTFTAVPTQTALYRSTPSVSVPKAIEESQISKDPNSEQLFTSTTAMPIKGENGNNDGKDQGELDSALLIPEETESPAPMIPETQVPQQISGPINTPTEQVTMNEEEYTDIVAAPIESAPITANGIEEEIDAALLDVEGNDTTSAAPIEFLPTQAPQQITNISTGAEDIVSISPMVIEGGPEDTQTIAVEVIEPTAKPTALPQTGFAEEMNLPFLIAGVAALVSVIFVSRYTRKRL